eukprot:COSAG03_NODE_25901_length_262_cov_2.177914_1_plen_50_part_01
MKVVTLCPELTPTIVARSLVAEPVVWRRASVMDRWVLRVLPQLLLRSCGS